MRRFLEFIKSKKSVPMLCIILFSALAGGYVLAHLFGGFTEKLTITPAVVATDTKYEAYDAYIFRDETVISSQYSGYRLDLLSDGEMAGIGTEFAKVYEAEASSELAEELELIDHAIGLFEKCCVTLNSSGIAEAKAVLKDGYSMVTERLSVGDTAAAVAYKQEITEALSVLSVNTGSKEKVEQNLAELQEMINDLKARRTEKLASLGTASESLKAERTGYYYSGIDGYEAIMSTAGIMEKPLSELLLSIELLGAEPQISPNAAGRMVYDPHWYAAVPVDISIAVRYVDEDGDPKYGPHTVDFYDGTWKRTSLTLERVVMSPEEDSAILLFSSSIMDIGFDGGRVRRIRILTNEYEGFRVPNEALREENGQPGVFILTYGTVEWRRVQVIHRTDSYVLVKRDPSEEGVWLALNDSMIVSGRDLYDGKTVD